MRNDFVNRINLEPFNCYFICDYIKFLLEQFPDEIAPVDRLIFDFLEEEEEKIKILKLEKQVPLMKKDFSNLRIEREKIKDMRKRR